MKDPLSGKMKQVDRPKEEWVVQERPKMRIIGGDDWSAAQRRWTESDGVFPSGRKAHLDGIVHAAGGFYWEASPTKFGVDRAWAVNYLGHVMLTRALWAHSAPVGAEGVAAMRMVPPAMVAQSSFLASTSTQAFESLPKMISVASGSCATGHGHHSRSTDSAGSPVAGSRIGSRSSGLVGQSIG